MVLIAVGMFIAVQAAKTEDFWAVLRPVAPPPNDSKGTVRVSPKMLLSYDVQARMLDFESTPARTVNDICAYDQRFSIDCKIPVCPEISIVQQIESGANQTVSPGFESPAVPRAVSFTRQSIGMGWTPDEMITFTVNTGPSRTIRARRRSAKSGLRVDFGTYLRPIDGVAISGNWIRERILGDDGSGAFVDTFNATLDVPLTQLSLSAHVGAWSLRQIFDGLPGAQFEMHEIESELTWQLLPALALSTGFLLDTIDDSSTLSSSAYRVYYAGLTTRASQNATFSIQVAHEKNSTSASGSAPFLARYSETSVRLELKLRCGEDFITKAQFRLRKHDYAQRNSFQDSLMSITGDLIF